MSRRKYPWLPYKYERMLREAEKRFEDGLIDASDVRCVEQYISKQLEKENILMGQQMPEVSK